MKRIDIKKPGIAIILFLPSFYLLSCQKEVDRNTLSPAGGNGGAGNNTQGSFHPTSAGSWWKYKDTATGSTSTSTIVNRTKTINGILYTAIVGENSAQKDTAWIASPQPNYYMYEKGTSPNTGASYDVTFHYLNDTASVGYNWQYTAGQGNGFTAYIQTIIVERNINMTVGGKSFNNVIHTRLIWSYDILGTVMEVMSYDYFIAKGVGIIKVRSEGQNLLSGFKACYDLIDYSIK
jgi:hypothetical protein